MISEHSGIVRGFLLAAVAAIIATSVLAVSASIPASDLGGGDEPILLLQDSPSPPPRLTTGLISGVTSTSWYTMNLGYEYDSMVVVASANYDVTSPPLVVRIRNASGTSFEVRVDRADGSSSPVTGIAVHFLAVEQGVYNVAKDGVKMEAVRYTSTITDHNAAWLGQSRSYSNSYTNPVVVGQVMTYNDTDFSVFWARGTTRSNPPSNTTLFTGKHVAEDPDTTRSNETIGYVVIEEGLGSIEGIDYRAELGADSVQGVEDTPPYTYVLSGISSASEAVVSSAGMDSSNGGWPLLYGGTPLSTISLNLAIDEDQLGDGERAHGTEQVAYLVFE